MPVLDFKGKQFVYAHHLTVPFRQLDIEADKSMIKDGEPSLDDNLIIHGDNLHALKALLPKYARKVNCIYIDPPYNTGNEGWCYNDKVNSPLMKEWLKDSANPVDKEDLERHDKWLCMMWPRMKLLQELLAEDGAIFVSIDHNEQSNLKGLMDEVFGEDAFIACLANVSNPKGRSDDNFFPTAHEYLLVYANKGFELGGWKPGDHILKRYNKTDSNGNKYREIDLRKTGDSDLREDRPDMFYYFYYNEEDNKFFVSKENNLPEKNYIQIKPQRSDGKDGRWRWGFETAEKRIDDIFPKFMPNRGVWGVFEKDFITDEDRVKPTTVWTEKAFNSERGTEQFLELGFDKSDFPRPKPVGLVQAILEIATKKDSIVLDSFAGSGTTAHAVLAANKEDGGNRKFILVECENYANKITAERARRVIRGAPKAKDITIKEGLGGSFTYCELGQEINIENLLKGETLPSYEELARYAFYTATGLTLDKVKTGADYLIGETENYRVHLVYKPELEFLRAGESALNMPLAKSISESRKDTGKTALVFATHKFMGQKELTEMGITYCQLPYAIHRVMGD